MYRRYGGGTAADRVTDASWEAHNRYGRGCAASHHWQDDAPAVSYASVTSMLEHRREGSCKRAAKQQPGACTAAALANATGSCWPTMHDVRNGVSTAAPPAALEHQACGRAERRSTRTLRSTVLWRNHASDW